METEHINFSEDISSLPVNHDDVPLSISAQLREFASFASNKLLLSVILRTLANKLELEQHILEVH